MVSNILRSRKGQVTIYVIIAIVILGGIVAYFTLKGRFVTNETYPKSLTPVFTHYSDCISYETRSAIALAGSQGGYVYVPEYAQGSDYAPFSSYLNFMGQPVPYWYYVSGNGLIKEQVPTITEIEKQMAQYISEGLAYCQFEEYRKQGYQVNIATPSVKVSIDEDKVMTTVTGEVRVTKDSDSGRKLSYDVPVTSKFGEFYSSARRIYDREKRDAFLENYAVDVLRMNAPVDGVLLQCGPKIWGTQSVMQDLRFALQNNLGEIKFKGSYYKLTSEKQNYFVVNEPVTDQVNVMYLPQWPTVININGEGVDDQMMIAESIGTQAGMGAMGFCYVPYHFIYDLRFPVMIQFFAGNELFQFPVVVVVDNNRPREANITGDIQPVEDYDLCKYSTQDVNIHLYNSNLTAINANLSFECFDQHCRLGESKNGKFVGKAPACVNGFIITKAGGYADTRTLMSTNSESFLDILLEREYEVNVTVNVGGSDLSNALAMVTFTKDTGESTSAALPEMKTVKLSEGSYNVTVYVYGNSSITIPATTKHQCQNVPNDGLLGLFGGTKEQCFDISIPATTLDFVLLGGGKNGAYFVESDLKKGTMNIAVDRLPKPTTLEQLQKNYEVFETKKTRIQFNDKK